MEGEQERGWAEDGVVGERGEERGGKMSIRMYSLVVGVVPVYFGMS